MGAQSGLSLGPVRVEQIYEQIARRILADIRSGLLAPGQRLPSERDLARQMQVGRSSVREAIGVLQVDRFVETRPGSGSFVAADAPERLRDEPPSALEAHDASPFALLQAREAFEPAVSRMAASHPRRDPFAERLLAEMEALSDPASADQRAIWSEADRLFHRQIGVMTGNPVVVGLCDQLAAIMDQPLWRRLRDDSLSNPDRMRIHIAEHRMIYEAVTEGDPEAAELYSRQHIRRVRKYMTLADHGPGDQAGADPGEANRGAAERGAGDRDEADRDEADRHEQ
jgi:DNA-binding FadR family transcriptional regulator